ncbi:MAG: hypothetical protein SGI99_14100 [Pseudomonadota bacterium]|nr:hypothetical protein [Pseudomonadota bacterium]
MSNVIALLEKLGQDATLRSAISDTVASSLENSEISPAIAIALSTGDQVRLVALLGARTNVSCMVFPSKQGDEEEEKQDDDKDVPDDDTKGLAQNLLQAALAS